jgi:hypothetical protein
MVITNGYNQLLQPVVITRVSQGTSRQEGASFENFKNSGEG